MVHTYTVKGQRRYRYYVCLTAQQQGWKTCPTKSVSANDIEQSVVEHIRNIGRDPRVVLEALQKAGEHLLRSCAMTLPLSVTEPTHEITHFRTRS